MAEQAPKNADAAAVKEPVEDRTTPGASKEPSKEPEESTPSLAGLTVEDATANINATLSGWWGSLQTLQKTVTENIRTKSQELETQVQSFAEQNPEASEKVAHVRDLVAGFGRAAGAYIDQADRRLEDMETNALGFIKDKGSELATKAKDIYTELEEEAAAQLHAPENSSGEDSGVIFNSGVDRMPVSRLDAQLLALHTTPAMIMDHAEIDSSTKLSSDQRKRAEQLLKDHADLEKLKFQLVPKRLTEDQFWLRYFAVRGELEEQDRKRKELLTQQNVDEDDDWGSSDDDAAADEAKEATKEAATTE